MALSLQRASGVRPTFAAARPRPAARLAVRASVTDGEKDSIAHKFATATVATAVASSLLLGTMVAPPAAEAARSGGRAGASGFSARRAQSYAPRRAAPQMNSYSSTTIVAAPPVFSPFGYGGFGYGGFSFMPIVPIPFFGGLLQFMFLMFMVSFVFNVIKGAIGGASGSSSKSKSQDWDDL